MSEKEIIEKTKSPIIIDNIYSGLRKLGVSDGDIILMHASMKSLGWVCGGAQSLLMGVMKAVGKKGTIVMTAHSGDWSDPINWQHPPVPEEWVSIIRENMPAYDKDMTPTRGIGKVAELFRTLPDVKRSLHPLVSFSAWGKLAEEITSTHLLIPQMGMTSPLGALYKLDAKVLFLGTGYDTCTSFHLAETMLDDMPKEKSGTAMIVDGKRQWVEFEDYKYSSDDFDKLGADFESSHNISKIKIGNAWCRLFNMKEAVDFARIWLNKGSKTD